MIRLLCDVRADSFEPTVDWDAALIEYVHNTNNNNNNCNNDVTRIMASSAMQRHNSSRRQGIHDRMTSPE